MTGKSTAAGSVRPHAGVRRRFRLTALFTEEELEAIRREAARHGMKPAAWLARLGTDTAAAAGGGLPAATAADVVAGMEAARKTAAKIGHLFNQAVTALHATGQHSPALEASGAAAARAVKQVERAVLAAAKRLP